MRPILLKTPWIDLYSYPFFLGMAFGLGIYMSLPFLPTWKGKLACLGTLASAFVGAKTFFALFSSPGGLSTSFLFGGGFVFYGGLLGGLAFLLPWSFWVKEPWPERLPAFLPPLVFSHALGRVGCFLTGCCFGKESSFYGELLHRHPTQLFEALGLFIIGLILMKKEKGRVVFYFLAYPLLRFGLEFLRGDEIRGTFLFLPTSQTLSLVLLLVAFLLALPLYKVKTLRSLFPKP